MAYSGTYGFVYETIDPTDEEIEAELAALNIPDGDEDTKHPDTQFSDFNSSEN